MDHSSASVRRRPLGEHAIQLATFPKLEETMRQFQEPAFQRLGHRKKTKLVSHELLRFIEEVESPAFLLGAVLEYISAINKEKLFDEPYTLTFFEFWLNHFSGLPFEEVLKVRGKIIGRYVPRDEYQIYFPVGSGKMFLGSHFVAAHISPDVDTTVASFWGWADAFGCRVAEGTHQWSLPSGLSDGHLRLYFQRVFGEEVFGQLVRPLPTMTISALDLLTKRDFQKISGTTRADTIDHSKDQVVVVVDEEGLYKGEWRSQDAEAVRQVVAGFSNLLRWFEQNSLSGMIHVLAQEKSTVEEVSLSYEGLLDSPLIDCGPVKELPERSKKLLSDYLKKVLSLPEGLDHSFKELLIQCDAFFSSHFVEFFKRCYALTAPVLFDASGILKADRVQAARAFEYVIRGLEDAVSFVRHKIGILDHLLVIKEKVLEFPSVFVTLKSDVEEMRSKIGHQDHITVVVQEPNGKWFPLGLVSSDDLKNPVLGTASFRDFSSVEETKMASYIEVISIVDHHKIRMQTTSVPTLILGDVQSSTTLVAEQALKLNTKYSEKANPHGYFVDKKRELAEYFSYIYSIIDETDLLTKISRRDVLLVKELLDRMKSLVEGSSQEAVSFSEVPNDQHFAKNAAAVLLRNKDLHSIYSSLYRFRHKEVETALFEAIHERPSTLFLDTKEQNGCCRVGQAKLFLQNIPTFHEHQQTLLALWQREAERIFTARPHIDLFIQMVTTVPGEEEVFAGIEEAWTHKDQLWIWTPSGGVPEQHLIWFLNSFQNSPTVKSLAIEVELTGPLAESRAELFRQNFKKASLILSPMKTGPSFAIMHFKAGAINSRKAQISPFLPKLLS